MTAAIIHVLRSCERQALCAERDAESWQALVPEYRPTNGAQYAPSRLDQQLSATQQELGALAMAHRAVAQQARRVIDVIEAAQRESERIAQADGSGS